MKLKNINIVWNVGGPSAVIGHPVAGNDAVFDRCIGACCSGWNREQFLIDVLHIIIRDKVDAMQLHRELLKIDEYRDMCASDMPGVSE